MRTVPPRNKLPSCTSPRPAKIHTVAPIATRVNTTPARTAGNQELERARSTRAGWSSVTALDSNLTIGRELEFEAPVASSLRSDIPNDQLVRPIPFGK